jgi:hypothetical protein
MSCTGYRCNTIIRLKGLDSFVFDPECGNVPKVTEKYTLLKAAMEIVFRDQELFVNPGIEEDRTLMNGRLLSEPTSKPLGLFDSGLHELWFEHYAGSWRKAQADLSPMGTSSLGMPHRYLGTPIKAVVKSLNEPNFTGNWQELYLELENK